MDNIEFYAAELEWQQAERDFMEAFRAFSVDQVWGSALDYAVFSTAGYVDAAQSAYMDVSIG